MTTRPTRAVLAVVSSVTLALSAAACGGGGKLTAPKSSGSSSGSGSSSKSSGATKGQLHTFKLANNSSVTVNLPPQPLQTVQGSISGTTLKLFLAKRQGDGAVLVVFAINSQRDQDITLPSQIEQALDVNYNHPNDNDESANNVALVDPAGLKEYQTFMPDPSNAQTCLCTKLAGIDFQTAGDYYISALDAAPPASVKTVTVYTGLGSFSNVPLT